MMRKVCDSREQLTYTSLWEMTPGGVRMVCHSDTSCNQLQPQPSRNIRILLVILPLIVTDVPRRISGWLFETRAE